MPSESAAVGLQRTGLPAEAEGPAGLAGKAGQKFRIDQVNQLESACRGVASPLKLRAPLGWLEKLGSCVMAKPCCAACTACLWITCAQLCRVGLGVVGLAGTHAHHELIMPACVSSTSACNAGVTQQRGSPARLISTAKGCKAAVSRVAGR